MTSVFVHGFEFGTDREALEKHFSGVGTITGIYFQSRGTAVVTYATADEAARAVKELHESYVDSQSRFVAVKLDEPRDGSKGKGKSKGKGAKGGTSGKGGDSAAGRTIFVTGFDFETDDYALKKHFGGRIGQIETFHFQSKRSAVITYVNASTAERAVAELDGSTMNGQSRYVQVKLDDPDRELPEGKGFKGAGSKGAGKPKGHSDSDNAGRAVYVSGFEYITDSEALEKHFSTVGKIESHYFQGKGSAVITYATPKGANRAVEELANTTMRGQSRYVAVKLDNVDHYNSSSHQYKGSGKGSWKGWKGSWK